MVENARTAVHLRDGHAREDVQGLGELDRAGLSQSRGGPALTERRKLRSSPELSTGPPQPALDGAVVTQKVAPR
jgi:hypothetical protein